jgi:hypothetical protein
MKRLGDAIDEMFAVHWLLVPVAVGGGLLGPLLRPDFCLNLRDLLFGQHRMISNDYWLIPFQVLAVKPRATNTDTVSGICQVEEHRRAG